MRLSLLASLGLAALTACRSSAPAEQGATPATAKPEIRYYEIADT